MNKELEEMVEELWNKMPSNELDEEEVYFGYKNTLRKALTQAHQAGRDEAVEVIREELRKAPLEVQMTKGVIFGKVIKALTSKK